MPRTRLTREDAIAIRKDGRAPDEIAAAYGKCIAAIYNILAHRSFPHIPPQEGEQPHTHGKRRGRKLTDAQVLAIRADKRKARVIAADYDTSLSTIYAIKKETMRRHVTDETATSWSISSRNSDVSQTQEQSMRKGFLRR